MKRKYLVKILNSGIINNNSVSPDKSDIVKGAVGERGKGVRQGYLLPGGSIYQFQVSSW